MRVEHEIAENFDRLKFKGPGRLLITQADEASIIVNAPAYVLKNICFTIIDGLLDLAYRNEAVISLQAHRENINYELCVKDLQKIVLQGNGSIMISDLDSDAMDIHVNGAGSVVVEQLTADDLKIKIDGSGHVNVAGDVETQHVFITGSGDYRAKDLVSDFAEVCIRGSGMATISANDSLSANIFGAGQISYDGYPDVHKLISGRGKLIRRRAEAYQPARGNKHG